MGLMIPEEPLRADGEGSVESSEFTSNFKIKTTSGQVLPRAVIHCIRLLSGSGRF